MCFGIHLAEEIVNRVGFRAKMKIAIIGAGFCGLAVAWHLLARSSFADLSIELIDKKGIGQGTSGIAAGLLHPFAGAHAKLNWRGREGVAATLELLDVAANALQRPVTANKKGILRLAETEAQHLDYQKCAVQHPEETAWLSSDECRREVPGCTPLPGLLIKKGVTVYSSSYLKGLWLACQGMGRVTFSQRKVETLRELDEFGHVIVTAGAHAHSIKELVSLPLRPVKGQVIEVAWPKGQPPLPLPLNSVVYLLMTESAKSCLIGATYEKEAVNESVDVKKATAELLPRAVALYPALEGAPVIGCYAGVRGAAPNHRPLLQRLCEKCTVLSGMGSKGLLYHALYARELAEDLQKSTWAGR